MKTKGVYMKNQAFTLIELLVVVLIIGILAAIAVPQYQKAVYKSRSSQAVVMLQAIMQAQRAYYLANSENTTDLTKLDINVAEDIMVDNVENKDPNTYYFKCASKKYCTAGATNVNMPSFEFHNNDDTQRDGMQYCISYGKSEMARDICKSMGPSDPSAWQPNDYYIIN